MQIKRELPWLGELPSHTVRYTMKYLAEAYKWVESNSFEFFRQPLEHLLHNPPAQSQGQHAQAYL